MTNKETKRGGHGADEQVAQHFLLIKQADHTPAGEKLNALQAAKVLLAAGVWPLWTRTPCKHQVRPGDRVAIYLAGAKNQTVVATASVRGKKLWTASMLRNYPLSLSGVPEQVLMLSDVAELNDPARIADHLDRLRFIGPNKAKWGVRLMGGMRSIPIEDFHLLTARSQVLPSPAGIAGTR